MKTKRPRKPSQRTVRRRLRELRVLIDDPKTDKLTARVAYTVEVAIRWATQQTSGWESPREEVIEAVRLINAGI